MSVRYSYFSFSPKRADEFWNHFPQYFSQSKIEGENRDDVQKIFMSFVTKCKEKALNEEVTESGLYVLDLYCGSIQADPASDAEYDVHLVTEALSEAAGLKPKPIFELKEDWLKFHSLLNESVITEAAKILIKMRFSVTMDSGRNTIIKYLDYFGPLFDDFEKNEDSIFIIKADVNPHPAPETADKLLSKRAREHLERFRDIVMSK